MRSAASVARIGAIGALVAACGGDTHDRPRIVSASDAILNGKLEHGFEAVGILPAHQDAEGGCTGSLVHPSWVLGARHCAQPASFLVGTDTAHLVSYPVDKVAWHPNKDMVLYHLTTTADKVKLLPYKPFKLPHVHDVCTAVGFGQHDDADAGVTTGKKRSCTESILSADADTITIERLSGIVSHGDSGGPLLCNGTIVAVVHGHNDGDAAAHKKETYTTIDPTWIDRVLSGKITAKPTLSLAQTPATTKPATLAPTQPYDSDGADDSGDSDDSDDSGDSDEQ